VRHGQAVNVHHENGTKTRGETFDRSKGDAAVMLHDDDVLGGRHVLRNVGDLFSELFSAVPGKPTVITREAHRKAVQPWANRSGRVIVRELTPDGKQHVLRNIRKRLRWNTAGLQDPHNET
jgi:hypothetical protein